MPRTTTCLLHLAILGCGLLLVTGCPPLSQQLPPPVDVGTGLLAEYVVNDVPTPSALALAHDGRVFYTEKNTGRIRVIKDGVLLEEPFAEVPVNYAGDRGLLGIALHPRFVDTRRVYVFYTRSDTGLTTEDPLAVVDNRVVYFVAKSVSGQPGDVASGGELFVASLPSGPNATRIGGRIGFAHDRTLYVALGDLTNFESAQNPDSLYGKVLRYNADGTIPEDNPTADSPVYARGFREPVGLSFDPQSRNAFIIERCANGRCEIDRIRSGGNYGWPLVSGFADTAAEQEFVAQNPDYVDPILDTGNQRVQLVGASFNPSTKYGPCEQLGLFYGDARNLRVYWLQLSAERSAVTFSGTFVTGFPASLTDVQFSPAGMLYVACEDAVLRITLWP